MCTNMGGRGGSSGLSGGGKAPAFEGSEKQVKWANDIVENAKKSLAKEVDSVEHPSVFSARAEEVERAKIIAGITNSVLQKLSSVWSAKDVIENRNELEKYPYSALGIKIRGTKGLKIGDTLYGFSDLKKSSAKKEFENKVIEYLKKKKG